MNFVHHKTKHKKNESIFIYKRGGTAFKYK
jgi:hypothetical protein